MSVAAESFWRRLRHTRMRDLLRGRIDGQLDWRRVLAEAELPAQLTEPIEQIVRRARLWKRERVDVAQELVTHFQDGLATGAPPESLAETFGDAKQTARLIRRAKRRCRPWWWQAWWWAWRAVVLAAGAYLAWGLWLLSGKPTVKVDYVAKLNSSMAVPPPSDAAWPLYLRAFRAIDGVDGDSLPSIGRAHQKETLVANPKSMRMLREGANKPTLGLGVGRLRQAPLEARRLFESETHDVAPREEIWEGSLLGAIVPHHLLSFITTLLDEDFRGAVENNEAQRALKDAVAILGIAKQVGEPATAVAHYIQHQNRGHARDLISQTIRERPGFWSGEQLKRLAHALAQRPRPPSYYLEGGYLLCQDVLQRIYTDDGAGDGRLTAVGIRAFGSEMGFEGRFVATLDPVGPARYGSSLLTALQMPRAAGMSRSRAAELRAINEAYQRARLALGTPLWRHPRYAVDEIDNQPSIVKSVGPSDRWMATRWHRESGLTDGVLIGIALELFHRENGDYPESLDELAPRWLPELPVDRINGGPLGYRVVDGEPVVYSLGVDGDDDGGRLPGYMNDAENERLGYSTTDRYRVGPPLTPAELAAERPRHYIGHDGDWVLWSLAEERYRGRRDGG